MTEIDKVTAAVHLLLSKMHLALAGLYTLTTEEKRLIKDLCDWHEVWRERTEKEKEAKRR